MMYRANPCCDAGLQGGYNGPLSPLVHVRPIRLIPASPTWAKRREHHVQRGSGAIPNGGGRLWRRTGNDGTFQTAHRIYAVRNSMTRRRIAARADVAVAAVYVSGRGGGESPGPLRLPTNPSGDSIITTKVGRAVILGTIVTTNPAAHPARLDRVSMQDATDGMRLEGAYAARVPLDTTRGFWAVAYWPPPGEHLHPLSAIAIPPNSPDEDHGISEGALRRALQPTHARRHSDQLTGQLRSEAGSKSASAATQRG
jgi:hypothetical protein